MFDRFSEKARRVIFFARQEAGEFGSPTIDTEHLLLGILRESPNLLGFVALSTAVQTVSDHIRQQCSVRDKIPTNVDLLFSETAKNVLHSSVDEADRLGVPTILLEHVLNGLLREENSLAQKVLAELGVTLETAGQRPLRGFEEGAATSPSKLRETVETVPNQDFQKVVTDAIEEARILRSASAKPEHLLVGLLRNEDSLAAQILREAGLDLAGVRRKLQGN
jgi:ATP-dependent Clp protease ATP-binding subunit ClpC